MPSPIHKYVIILFVSLPFRRSPDVFMNVLVQEHHVLNKLDFLMWQGLLFEHNYHHHPDVDSHSQLSVLKIFSLPTFTLKFLNRIFIWYFPSAT